MYLSLWFHLYFLTFKVQFFSVINVKKHSLRLLYSTESICLVSLSIWKIFILYSLYNLRASINFFKLNLFAYSTLFAKDLPLRRGSWYEMKPTTELYIASKRHLEAPLADSKFLSSRLWFSSPLKSEVPAHQVSLSAHILVCICTYNIQDRNSDWIYPLHLKNLTVLIMP